MEVKGDQRHEEVEGEEEMEEEEHHTDVRRKSVCSFTST